MIENQDFVFVTKAKTVDPQNITEQITGLFVGTQNYFFFFPEKSYQFQSGYSSGTITHQNYTFGGEPIPKLILSKLSQCEEVEEFEAFVVSDLLPQMGSLIRVYPHSEISAFKVQAGWFSSGVVARLQGESYQGMKKFSGTLVALKLGHKKKEIKAFYSQHPKYQA